MIYKVIFIAIIFLFPFYVDAQLYYSGLVFETEYPNGRLELDSIPNMQAGKKYLRCLIQDQYYYEPNAYLSNFPQQRLQHGTYISPVYDSLVESVEIRAAYSFYEVNRKVKLPRHTKIIPPTWDFRVLKGTFLKQRDWYLAQILKNTELQKDEDCFSFAVLESTPIDYKTYACFLKTPAILVKKMGNQLITDTLTSSSPYLKVTDVPARRVLKTTFIQKTKPRFIFKINLDTSVKPYSKAVFRKDGGITEWREWTGPSCEYRASTVYRLQRALRKQCYFVKVTNEFDAETKKALIRFQKKHHLPTGNFDSKTLKKLGLDNELAFCNEQDAQMLRQRQQRKKNGDIYKRETYTIQFKYDPIDDFKDAFQMTFLTDLELAQLMDLPIEIVRDKRKNKLQFFKN